MHQMMGGDRSWTRPVSSRAVSHVVHHNMWPYGAESHTQVGWPFLL